MRGMSRTKASFARHGASCAWACVRAAWLLAAVLFALAAQASPRGVELQPVRVVIDEGRGPQERTGVKLPYRWDRDHRFGGTASFEFEVAPRTEPGPAGIYLPRIGNSFRVWIDGVLIADNMQPDPRWVNTNQMPRLVPLPEGARAGARLKIQIAALAGADGGLSAVVQGSGAELAKVHADAVRWRWGSAVAVSVVSLILGALAFLVWFNQRDRLYLWYACAEVFWSMRTAGHYLGDGMWLPWPWWGAVLLVLYCGAFASMCYFGLTLAARQSSIWGRLVLAFAAASALMIAISHGFELHAWWRAWRFAIIAVCAACAGMVLHAAIRTRALEPMVLSAVFGIGLLIGLRDWLVITVAKTNYTAMPWITYVWLLFGLAMAWLLANRLRLATHAQARHAHELASRLSAQEVELGRAFALQREASQQQAAQEERRRVLQDMHDGVGHELLGALQVAQEGAVPREIVTGQIQRAMDHLKLTVDALQEGSQDVGTVLGLLRYRLAPRLQAAGIEMDWRVAPVPTCHDWDTRKARDLQLLMYEAFTNLLVHAGATRVFFETAFDPWQRILRITLADNGRGLPAENVGRAGNGLSSMRTRAQRLGGALNFGNGAVVGYPGAGLELRLPFGAEPEPQSQPLSGTPGVE
jgi:signal transduction histidine kinase